MGDAATTTAAELITKVNYELRNSAGKQYTDSELLSYINKCCELIHNILVDMGSELIRSGTGTITTEAGTEQYSLVDNSMGDLWLIHAAWIDTQEPLEECDESERYPFLALEADADETGRSEPKRYYIEGDNIGFLPFPDDEYTVNFKYYPNFVALSDTAATIPYRGLFNLQIEECVKIIAKNRNVQSLGIDASFLQIFQDRALAITRKRSKREYRLIPRFR